jgi:hypothetical protein
MAVIRGLESLAWGEVEKKKGPEGPLCARPIYQRDFKVTP